MRNGVLTTIPGGMQTMKLKKGDIVINAEQMRQLRKGQKVTASGGRGKLIGSFAKGSISSGMGAYVDPPAGSASITLQKTTPTSGASSKSTKANTKATNDNTKSKKKNTDADDKNTTAADKVNKKFEKLYDFIEIWIERVNQKIDRWTSKAELFTKSIGGATKSLNNQIKYYNKAQKLALASEKKASKSAQKYLKIANRAGLTKAQKKLVQNGGYKTVKEYGTDSAIRAKYDQYKTWYDKYLGALDQQTEWQAKYYELEESKLEAIQSHYEAARAGAETAISNREAVRGRREAAGIASTIASYRNDNKNEATIINSLIRQRDRAQKELDNGGYKKNSDEYKQRLAEIKSLNGDIAEHEANIYENTKKMRDLQTEANEHLRNIYNGIVGKLENLVKLTQTHGNRVDNDLYKNQIEQQRNAYATISNDNKVMVDSWTKYLKSDGMWGKELSRLFGSNKKLSNAQISTIVSAMKSGDTNTINKTLGSVFGKDASIKRLPGLMEDMKTYLDNEAEILSIKDTIEGLVDATAERYTGYLNDVKDRLEDIHSAAERALELQKAQYELDKALNDKTIRTWNGREWVYTNDTQVAREAQESLDEANYKYLLEDIDKTIENIEKYIKENANLYKDNGADAYNNWKSAFDDFVDELDNMTTKMANAVTNSNYDLSGIKPYATGGVVSSKGKNDNTLIRVSDKERILTPEQNALFEQLVARSRDILTIDPFENLLTKMVMQQTPVGASHPTEVNQIFNITLPNINDATSADKLMRDLQSIATKKLQFYA